MEYYVYQLIDPRNDLVFYIGKGHKKRMYEHVRNVRRGLIPNKTNLKLGNKIKKILSFGLKVKYKKIFITTDENEAYKKEKEYIYEIGMENLCNITAGGAGGKFWLGKTRSKETKQKISKAKMGLSRSNETKKRISVNNAKFWLGKTRSKETKQKISRAHKGKTLSIKTKKKVSKNNARYFLGKSLSDNHKEKISNSMKGIRRSEETKKKISESMKNRFKKKLEKICE